MLFPNAKSPVLVVLPVGFIEPSLLRSVSSTLSVMLHTVPVEYQYSLSMP